MESDDTTLYNDFSDEDDSYDYDELYDNELNNPVNNTVNNINSVYNNLPLTNDMILEVTKHMDTKTYRLFCASNPQIRALCQRDTFSSITNTNSPAFLMTLDLDTLNTIVRTNNRLGKITNNNHFWYLKLERDYPDYITLWKNKNTYLSKLIYQDMLQSSKEYYILYYYYHTCPKNIDNTPDMLIKFIQTVQKYPKTTGNILKVLSLILSLIYSDMLEKRLLKYNVEILSTQTMFSALFPSTYNNRYIKEGINVDYPIWVVDGFDFTPLPTININLHCLNTAYLKLLAAQGQTNYKYPDIKLY